MKRIQLIDYFIELLKRGNAPKGVTFLASVPGNYRSKWGTYGLAKLKDELDTRSSTEIGIIVPYVGKWDTNDLKYWTSKIGSSPDNLTLMWVDKNNHLANFWMMPKETFEQLKHCGANIRRLLPSDNNGYGKTHCIHDKQPQNDTRWSHSKIYELKRGKSRRIIITSANFSSSAWGKRKKNYLKINNFEFGVAISGEYNWSIIENEHLPDNSNELNLKEAYLEEDKISESDEKGLVWASAEWNGEKIDIKASTASSTKYPDETVIVFAEKNGMAEVIKKNKWKRDNHLWEWSTKWVHKKDGMPFFVSIKYNSEIYKITLNDLRNDDEKDSDPIPEVDPKISQELKDAIFLEQFDGPSGDDIGKNQKAELEDNDEQEKFKTRQNNGKNNNKSDYSLPWLIQAQEWFNIVDSWDEKCKSSSIDIEQTGNKLIEIICRKKLNSDDGTRVAAEVVADEIKMRMRGKNGQKN